MKDNYVSSPRKAKWRPSISFWIMAAVWVLLLILMTLAGKFGIWLVLFALFAILSALYSLVSGRRSWLGLPRRKAAGVAVGTSFGVLVLGIVVAAITMPTPQLATLASESTSSATSSATPTTTPTPASVLLTDCPTAEESFVESGTELVCTPDDAGTLVWMTADTSKALLADRAAAKSKVEADSAASKKAEEVKAAAVQKAAVQKKTDQAAAVEAARASAAKAASEAAAAEAARVAVEQAVQQQAPVAPVPVEPAPIAPAPVVDVPAASSYYPNCAAAKAAGAAPMYAGHPGYRAGLDRDKDGIACDK